MEMEASVREKLLERGRRNFLLVLICFLVVGLAAPLLLVFLIKSPQPGQHIVIFGISYYKLVFIFLLSAAIVVHTSLFFLRAKPLTIFIIFVLALFCCFPLVVGLRNNLTLHQAIVDIPFFKNWPFFLKPGYIMIEFLIPAGIVIYLFLQIRSIFSKKSHGYVFSCAAVYLLIAASLGFSALIQAEQPNLVTALARKKADSVQKDIAAVFPETLQQDFVSAKDNLESAGLSTFLIPQVPNRPEPEHTVSKTPPPAEIQEPAPDKMGIVELEQQVQLLSGKVDRVIVEIGEMKTLIIDRQEKLEKMQADAAVQKTEQTEGSESPRPSATEPPVNAKAIAELRQEVRHLTDKTDRVLDALGQMGELLPEQQEKLRKDGAVVEDDAAVVEEKES